MPRARLYRPVTDEMGNLVADIDVRLINPDTNQTITAPVYLGPLTDQATAQPIHFTDGVISLYLDTPRRVRLGVKKGAGAERFYEDIDVLVTALEGIGASAVSFVPSAAVPGDDVQEAVGNVQDNLFAHIDEDVDAHAASAISSTPVANVGATNVQGALADLATTQAELEALTTDHSAELLALDGRIDSLETQGPVYTAPNGSQWRLVVANDGTFSGQAVSPAPKPPVTALTGTQEPNGTLTWDWTEPTTPLADDDPTTYRSEVFLTTGGANTLTATQSVAYGTSTDTVVVAADNTWRVDVYAVYPTGDSAVASVAIGLYVPPAP